MPSPWSFPVLLNRVRTWLTDLRLNWWLWRLRSPSASFREQAALQLCTLQDARVVPPLLDRLDDPDEDVRSTICDVLGILGDARALDGLIARLYDTVPYVQSAACEALGAIGDPTAVDALITRLLESDDQIDADICWTLGTFGEARAVRPLLPYLQAHNPLTRLATTETLGLLGDTQAFPFLLLRLQDDDPTVRAAVCRALGNLDPSSSVSHLLTQLDDPSPTVRIAACQTLGLHPTDAILDPLLDRLWNDVDGVAEAAYQALAPYHTRLIREDPGRVCQTHLTRFAFRRTQRNLLQPATPSFWVCRQCGAAQHAFTEIDQVMAVLDEHMSVDYQITDRTLRVNWLTRRALFDIEGVEVIHASDYAVQQLGIQMANAQSALQGRLPSPISCVIDPGNTLSENTRRILQRSFRMDPWTGRGARPEAGNADVT